MPLAHPWFLCGLLIIPILTLFYIRAQKKRTTIGYSDLSEVRLSGQSWRQHFIHLPFLLILLGIGLLIYALARPQEGIEKTEQISHGIGIEIVMDRSSSMAAMVNYEGQEMNRLEAVKKAFAKFVFGDDKDLTGRANDLIGIITYAQFAETVCPLTLAHDTLDGFINQIKLATQNDPYEDGTAIGDALALAAARLHEAGNSETDGYELKSKIIILLTDGIQTAGQYSPLQGATLAKDWNIKVYTIYIGDKPQESGFFRMGNRGAEAIGVLKGIAKETGGMFWQANGGNNLHDITTTINELEKSKIESIRYMDYKEFFHYYLLAGLASLSLGFILKWTILGVLT